MRDDTRQLSPATFNRVAVLKGGPSAEREVSLRSGAAVAEGLRQAGYDVTEIDVKGREFDLDDSVEAVFIALHGAFGEDGEVQRLLEDRGMPYTGPGPLASEKSFDKHLTKLTLDQSTIPTAEYEVISSADERTLDFPLVVKPLREGSSIGVHLVMSADQWADAFAEARTHGDRIMVERYIEGRELTVGIVGDEALPVVEIVAPGGWYDYGAKYTSGRSNYLVPAPLESDVAELCRDIATRTFKALGCRGLSRIDFRLENDGPPLVLEINTIPGFTRTSLLPKAAREAGMNFPELCDRIMELAAIDSN